MFLRIARKAIIHRRGRIGVAMIALIVGAGVTAAMLSVYYDAGRKMSREMRAYGANVMLAPSQDGGFIDETVMGDIDSVQWPAEVNAASPYLYAVATVGREQTPLVLTGLWFDQIKKLSPWWQIKGRFVDDRGDDTDCLIGSDLAKQLGLSEGQAITIAYGSGSDAASGVRRNTFSIAGVVTTGGAEDNQVLVSLRSAQQLTGLQGKSSAVAVSAVGGVKQVESLAGEMDQRLTGVHARVVRQIAEGEGRVLTRLRLMMLLVTAFILVGAALSVATTLTSLVIERRREIGTMKAIGAGDSGLLRLFLFELGTLGVVGGAIGYGLGIGLAQAIGRSLFHSAVAPSIMVLAIVLVVSLAIAMLSGLVPIRKIREVEPAVILKGE
jgi:putative ABC transport system permease protein